MNPTATSIHASPVRALTEAAALLSRSAGLPYQPAVSTEPGGHVWMRWFLDLAHNAGEDVQAQLSAAQAIVSAVPAEALDREWQLTKEGNDVRTWETVTKSGLVHLFVLARRPWNA